MTARLGFIVAVISLGTTALAADPKPIPNATEYRNVRYLPDWRYSGDPATHRDYQMLLDVAVPQDGREQHPVLFVVHGGGWSGGSKDQNNHRDIMSYFVERGFVAVNLNYIMRPRGIFPQVFWDYADAARFIRKNSATYKADPARFGAIGLSAGGWLISSAGHGSGDLLCTNHQQSMHIADLWQRGWSRPGRHYEENFARPIANRAPAYPGLYGRFQAISYDFSFRTQFGSGNSPACNQWMGEGYQLPSDVQTAIDQSRFEFTRTVLTHPGYKGRKVHVPPLFESLQKDGSDKAEAVSRDGKSRVPAIERIYQFFQHQLVDNPRTPVPEVHPANRFFSDTSEVEFVLPIADATIRYQVLPIRLGKGKTWRDLQPPVAEGATSDWTEYSGPFRVESTCLVRAIASSPNRRDSTIAEAHYFKGVSVPRVTGPDVDVLPPGETGKRYSVRFTSNSQTPRWFLAGDLVPYPTRHKSHFTYPNNMVMNYRAGEWSGTPIKPGRYWVQVWVNDRPGSIATHRNYIWKVTGKDLSDSEDRPADLADRKLELVFFPGERNYPAPQISALLNEHGIPCIVDRDKNGSLMLVNREQVSQAQMLAEQFLASIKFKGEVRWLTDADAATSHKTPRALTPR